jgi:hypothetical protein
VGPGHGRDRLRLERLVAKQAVDGHADVLRVVRRESGETQRFGVS